MSRLTVPVASKTRRVAPRLGDRTVRRSAGFLAAMLAIGPWLDPGAARAVPPVVQEGWSFWVPDALVTAPAAEAFVADAASELAAALWDESFEPALDRFVLQQGDDGTALLALERGGDSILTAQLWSALDAPLLTHSGGASDEAAGGWIAVTASVSLLVGTAAATDWPAGGEPTMGPPTTLAALVWTGTVSRDDGAGALDATLVPLAIGEPLPKLKALAATIAAWAHAGAGPASPGEEGVVIDCLTAGEGARSDSISCDCACSVSLGGLMLECSEDLALKLLACAGLYILGILAIIAACAAPTPAAFAACAAAAAGLNGKVAAFCAAWAVGSFLDCGWDASQAYFACVRECP